MKVSFPIRIATLFALTLASPMAPLLVSCQQESSSFIEATPGSGGSGGGSGGSSSSSSCTTSVIDYGQKGIVTAVSRGTYSDTEMIPSGGGVSLAYFDSGSLSVKLGYWNGNQLQTEVIAGEGAATFVRLAYFSDGRPLVVWAQGANLKAAIRSAAPSSSGTWTVGIIDTGVAPRAVEVAINPLDQAAVSFLTDTAVTGRPKFTYCDSPCTTPTGFQTMSPNPYIENTNVIAAETSTGIGWCKSSSTTYYPAVTYSVTGIVRYAVCLNTLSNCLSSANWSTQTVVAAGNIGSKLLLDPTVTGDVAKVVSTGAGGMIPYRMGATACTAAPAAFVAGAAMGGATSGNAWMSLMKDSGGKFHLVANESTTSVRYYNSTTTTITGAWNAAGTIETTTLLAASAGGATIDDSTSGVYATYGMNVAPFDLRLGRVEDYTTASNSARFTRFDTDLTGSLQLAAATAQLQNVAVASTSSGRPAAAYVDFSAGAATGAKIRYAYRSGASATSAWQINLVGGTTNPQFPSLAFDDRDRPWIGYFEASSNRFFLATNSMTDGSGVWSNFEFPSVPSGAPPALPAANQTSVAMHYSGRVSYPVLLIIDNNAGSRGLKAARFNRTTQAWSTPSTIDALNAAGASHLSSDFDTSGNIVVAFRDLNLTRSRYSNSTNGTSWSTPLSVSGVGQGAGARVRVNTLTNSPSMTYFDRSTNSVFYASCSGSYTSCATAGWSTTTIDSSAGVSGLVSGNEQVLATDFVFSDTGEATVIYPRGQGASGNLMRADNGTGSFVLSTLASGQNGAVSGSAALNFGISGWNAAGTRNSTGNLTSVFVGPGNWLYSTSCGD